MSRYLGIDPRWYLGVVAAAGLFALGSLPELVKNALMLLLLSTYTLSLATSLSGMKLFFFLLFTAGPTLLLIASLARKEKDLTFAPLMLLLVPALGQLVLARDLLQFFFAWEWMTVASYFLVLKGKKAETGALTYIAFSVGGAFFLLAAVALGQAQVQSWGYDLMNGLIHHRSLFFALASVAFLVKMGAMGLHLWLPSSYTEAPDDVTPVLSAVLSKAGVMGLLILLLSFGAPVVYRINLATLLGWLGILTAFGATLVAIFQEDAKKLLAYSSMGQIGYIMVGFTTLSHLGWVSALYHTANHFLFKGLLFLAVAGVVYRVKTRNMYEMGGLIKRMPFSYFSVMIGIIAMSGVPPLTGFGSKWLLYEAMIERGWYLQTGIAFMSSTIAFLYLFRLVHSIFLGMPKEAHLEIKEAPLWFLIPQGLLILAIMVASMVPKWVIEPLSNWVHPILPATVRWEGHTLFSTLGYWNGSMMMVLVMSIFMGLLLWMWIARPKLQQVKPFNIGFAGEAPQRPEWTHYAYGFFEPYRRAFGPLLGPWVERSYASLYRFTQDCATLLRGIYTGNAQTYALFILITAVFTFFFTQGR
jgi:formate hydrogenlyase subunit 3/multisubunit Na+/H+ antiporter MnhD subunit